MASSASSGVAVASFTVMGLGPPFCAVAILNDQNKCRLEAGRTVLHASEQLTSRLFQRRATTRFDAVWADYLLACRMLPCCMRDMPVQSFVTPRRACAALRDAPDPSTQLERWMPARSVPNAYAARATRRCATIFAGTRRLIAQRGLLKVTMRHLAEEGDASIQTLYNLVGDRERIIVEALKEHIGAMSV
ncbi:MAG: TetR family transcriptional regulator, partial [Burkholderiales bacterium]